MPVLHSGIRGRPAAIELPIRDVSKTYSNGVRALRDVALTNPLGMYGLLGPNGAGTSTLMRTVATLQEPDEGRIPIERNLLITFELLLLVVLGRLLYSVSTSATAAVDNGCSGTLHLVM